jgi:hypothetical protein
MAADGTWNITLNAPMGAQQTTMTLATSDSELTGEIEAPPPIGKVELSDGTVDGDNLTWKVNVTTPMPMVLEFAATVDGDKISGDVKFGSFGNGTLSGVRA